MSRVLSLNSVPNGQLPTLMFRTSQASKMYLNSSKATTIGLPDEQRPKLLIKAFMPDQYQPWFESELTPRISAGATWPDLKRTLVERFANVSEQERHIDKLRALDFKPEAGTSETL